MRRGGAGGRCGPQESRLQAQFRKQIESNLEVLSEALGQRGGQESRETALLILSTLYGALMMARAVGDSPLSREVLRTVRKRVLALTEPRKSRERVSRQKHN